MIQVHKIIILSFCPLFYFGLFFLLCQSESNETVWFVLFFFSSLPIPVIFFFTRSVFNPSHMLALAPTRYALSVLQCFVTPRPDIGSRSRPLSKRRRFFFFPSKVFYRVCRKMVDISFDAASTPYVYFRSVVNDVYKM